MKLASILPIHNFNLMFDQPYAMMLTHLSDHYLACNNTNCYRIMDNSLIELGGAVNLDKVLAAAKKHHVQEIILPDVFRKSKDTLESVKKSIDTLYKENEISSFRLMAVAQGSTVEEFAHCFEELCKIPEIHCIGIPKVTEELMSSGRPGLENLWQGCPKSIHLLGVWTNLSELLEYKNPALIRSVDTCIPALLSKTTSNAWTRRPEKTIDLYKDSINEENYVEIMAQLAKRGFVEEENKSC